MPTEPEIKEGLAAVETVSAPPWVLRHGPRVRQMLLMAALVGTPLLFSRWGLDPINVPKLGWLLALCAVVAALRLVELAYGGPEGGLRFLAHPALFIIVPLSIAWIASPYKEWSLFGEYSRFQGLIPYIAVVAFGVLLADAFSDGAEPIAWGLAIAGAMVGAYALVQYQGWDPLLWRLEGAAPRQATSTLGNPNYVGGFLAICLPVVGGLWLSRSERRLILSVGFLLVLGGLVVSFSQGAWAAGAAGGLLLAGFAAGRRWPAARLVGGFGAFCVAAATAGVVLLAVTDTPNPFVNDTVMARAWHWRTAAGMASQSPLWGRGPNTFALEGVRYRPVDHAMVVPHFLTDDPHSVPFSFVTAAGVLGIIGLVLLLLWIVRRAQGIGARDQIGAGLVGAAAAYFVQSLVGKDELSLRVALWAVLGGLAANSFATVARARTPLPQALARGVFGVAVVIGSVAVLWSLAFVRADVDFARGITLYDGGQRDDAAALFGRATGFREEIHYRYVAGRLYGQGALRGASDAGVLETRMEESFGYLRYLPHVEGLTEYGVLASSLASDGPARTRSLEILRRARRLDPVNAILRVYVADLLMSLDRDEEAYRELEPLIFLFPRFPEYWGGLALAEARLGRFDDARASIGLARSFDPEDVRAQQAEDLIDDPALRTTQLGKAAGG